MPELPEVETTKKAIKSKVVGQKIKALIIRHYQLRWPIPRDLASLLKNQTILNITRRGKYLLFQFKHGTLLLHLGMSGSLRLLKNDKTPEKHDHVDLILTNGFSLRLRDPRRFGALLWTQNDLNEHPLLRHLGPEPLTAAFNADYLFARSRGKTIAVKNFIMNSKIVVGVGNIYAQEALFLAHIKPQRKAGSLKQTECEHLVQAIKKVLQSAIRQGGTSLRDFITPEGTPGYFSVALQVYDRGGESCFICRTKLQSLRIGNRSTVYCKQCQR